MLVGKTLPIFGAIVLCLLQLGQGACVCVWGGMACCGKSLGKRLPEKVSYREVSGRSERLAAD